MRLELTGRHVTITPVARKTVEKSLARVERLLNNRALSAQVVITKEKARFHAEMTLHARGEHFFHGEGAGKTLGLAVTAAAEKVERQAQKLKSRWVEGKRQGVSAGRAAATVGGNGAEREPEPRTRIIRARRYAVKPMSVDEAAMEVGAAQDAFVVFRNDTTDTINVIFRRADGNLGLIEPEA